MHRLSRSMRPRSRPVNQPRVMARITPGDAGMNSLIGRARRLFQKLVLAAGDWAAALHPATIGEMIEENTSGSWAAPSLGVMEMLRTVPAVVNQSSRLPVTASPSLAARISLVDASTGWFRNGSELGTA